MPMNNWIINKIASLLMIKEGCTVTGVTKTHNEATEITIQDVFGYRYQVTVTLIARINDNKEGMEVYESAKELDTRPSGSILKRA